MTKPEASVEARRGRGNVGTPAAEAKAAKPTESGTSVDTTVKRGPGRPPGTNKKPVSEPIVPKVPGKRGRKPKPVSPGDPPKKVVTTPGKRGRKRKVVDESTIVAKVNNSSEGPRKRGRPAGSGKKQIAAAAKESAAKVKEATVSAAAAAAVRKVGSLTLDDSDKGDDDTGAFNGIKLTIERCTTCTQYHKNALRIFEITKNLYPDALTHEEVVPNSKSFEIYLSRNGSKNKLIWSGKAHAPPKKLAFPESPVFTNLLKNELK